MDERTEGTGGPDSEGSGRPAELVPTTALIIPPDQTTRRFLYATVGLLALSLIFGALWLNHLGNRLDVQGAELLRVAKANAALSTENHRLNETSTRLLSIIQKALDDAPAQQKAFFDELTKRVQAAINNARFSIESQITSGGSTRTIVRVVPSCTGPPGRCR